MPILLSAVSIFALLILSERKGNTLHLLKQSAKPSKQREYRKKYAAVSFEEFKLRNDAEESKEIGDKEMGDDTFADVTHHLRKSKRNRGPIDPHSLL